MTKLSNGMTGVAGEYAVAMELSKRGYIATVTLRNTKGIDILASNEDGSRTVSIQVKTSKKKERGWILSEKAEKQVSENFFYVFVNLDIDNSNLRFHIVPSKVVAEYICKDHQDWLSSPGKKGQARKDTPMRKFLTTTDEYLNNWDLLGLS